jgi:hypothetical protein
MHWPSGPIEATSRANRLFEKERTMEVVAKADGMVAESLPGIQASATELKALAILRQP